MIVHFNNLSYEASNAGDRYRQFESNLESLKLAKFTAQDSELPFTQESKLKEAEFQYEREATKIDAIMNDLHTTYKLISKCIHIMHQGSGEAVKLLGHDGFSEIEVRTKEAGELAQLDIVCRNAELYPYYDATKAALKRGAGY